MHEAAGIGGGERRVQDSVQVGTEVWNGKAQ
jgi:hypothetical protein